MDDLSERVRASLAGRYTIERELGRGGMATVYLARDLKHDRPVALKVLRPELAAVLGAERFLREIRLTAQLQHPHILTLIDSGEAEGFLYYVMPYVEGESLRQRLEREGQLPLDEALRITRAIASALDFAHARGVIHRDIKPENIMLHQGEPMVADFGIALAVSSAGRERLTETGLSLGTPAYMSPEQASAEPKLDGRTDQYSLACVLYEMLAGEPPYTGPTAQAIIAKRLSEPIPHLRTVRDVPEAVERAVTKALAKAPADRYATADQFVAALAPGVRGFSVPRHALRIRAKLRAGAVIAAAALVVAVLLALLGRGGPQGAPVAAARHSQLTFEGTVIEAELSPSGELLAYISQLHDTQQLLVRDLKGGTTVKLAQLGAVHGSLRWSPDGSVLLYAGLDSVGQYVTETFPRLGGTPRPLPRWGAFAAWSPNGARLAQWLGGAGQPRHRIFLTTLATGDTSAVAVLDSVGFIASGDWSPTGSWLALLATSESRARWGLWTVAVDGSGWQRVVEDSVPLSPPRWSPSGDGVYYLRGNELRRIRVTSNGRPDGVPGAVQTGLQWSGSGGVSITADGGKLAYIRSIGSSNLWLATTDHPGKGARFATTRLTRGTASKSLPHLSPDRQSLAFVKEENGRNIFTLPISGGEPRQITFTGAVASDPAWSPDGHALAFCTNVGGVIKVLTVAVEGKDERTYGRTEASSSCELAWAPGPRIIYQRPGNRSFHVLDPVGETEAPLVGNDSLGWMFQPLYSPDGERVAIWWNRMAPRSQSEATGVWVISLKDSSNDSSHFLVHRGLSHPLGWSADGRSVYVQDEGSNDILLVPATGGKATLVGTQPFENAYCIPIERGGGLTLLCVVDEGTADAWMIENFDPGAASGSGVLR